MSTAQNTAAKIASIQADYEGRIDNARGELRECQEVNRVLSEQLKATQFREHYSSVPFLLIAIGIAIGVAIARFDMRMRKHWND